MVMRSPVLQGGVWMPSRSDDVPQPRTGAEMVQELHDLLQAAEVPGPYVLVGHSVGASTHASTP